MEHDADTSVRPPHSISEYTLLEFLGEGATAQVYLAEHEASGAHVAIKVIDKLLIQRAQLESKVRQEMVLHSELQHPHVLRVESVFEDARNYYMVLEYCARRSLSAIVKTLPGRKMDEQIAKKIFRQVVAGVVYLHASGVIHRDLKLANLLLNGNGEVKISDFGLAARLGDDHVTMCGTPNFIAPEVLTAEDEPYDEAVDVWSLGCILYCLLLGKAPFEGRKVSETLENVANAGQTPLKFSDGFSSSASDLIKRMLTSDPRSRPSAQQIMLHPWLREQSMKRAPPASNGRRKSLPRALQPVPPHPRASSRSPEKLRKSRRTAATRSMKEEELLMSSSSSSIPAYAPGVIRSRKEEELPLSSSSLSIPASALPRCAGSFVSVVMHLELQDVSCFGLSGGNGVGSSDAQVQLEWRCKEPAEVGKPPTFELKVSNGWEVCYDPSSGVLTAITSEGDPLRYEIPGANGARATSSVGSSSSRASTARFTQRAHLPPLVRFCQCLALRTMQLRQIALRGQASKLPFIHYDTLPESLLASFRYRSNLLASFPNQSASGKAGLSQSGVQGGVDIAGVGRGFIDNTGDLRVVFLDGAQLTLAASGLQLRFRPSWANDGSGDESANEDVFELLTTSSMSSFLPTVVKQKLESIPEFIRRLKATS